MSIGSILRDQTVVKSNLIQTGAGHVFFVASVQSPADVVQAARESYTRIAETLREHHLEIVHERIFGKWLLSVVLLISLLSAWWPMSVGKNFCLR